MQHARIGSRRGSSTISSIRRSSTVVADDMRVSFVVLIVVVVVVLCLVPVHRTNGCSKSCRSRNNRSGTSNSINGRGKNYMICTKIIIEVELEIYVVVAVTV